MAKKRLGDVLRERGHLPTEDLATALEDQRRQFGLLGEVLLQRGLVSKKELVAALEEITGVPYLHSLSTQVDPEVLKLIPREVAVRHCVLPFTLEGRKIIAIMAEPQNLLAVDELSFIAGKPISPRLGFRSEILSAIGRYYGEEGAVEKEEGEKAAISGQIDLTAIEFVITGSHRA